MRNFLATKTQRKNIKRFLQLGDFVTWWLI